MSVDNELEKEIHAPARKQRNGFIPFYANAFDRGFISVMILIGIHLLWLRFLESFLPIEVGTIISLIIGYIIIRWG